MQNFKKGFKIQAFKGKQCLNNVLMPFVLMREGHVTYTDGFYFWYNHIIVVREKCMTPNSSTLRAGRISQASSLALFLFLPLPKSGDF
jgi:hypothetical protein